MSSKLGQPGVPRATSIDINAITITWRPPETGKVKSYRVLYRPEDEPEFRSVDSLGTMLTRHVNGLSHGVKYYFKVEATSESGEKAESADCVIKTKEYYDIVLVGKTGQGKSTFGNKLLDIEDNTDGSGLRLFESDNPSSQNEPDQDNYGYGSLSLSIAEPWRKRFVQATDNEVVGDASIVSVTAKCKLLANDNSNIRVLDVPGFSDSGTLQNETGKKVSVQEGNLQIIRYIVRAQVQSLLKVRRIVYFLPGRGPLEKADRTMQEELEILYHYFGKEVFDCLVVAATNSPRKKYQIDFDEDDFQMTKKVFEAALKLAVPDEEIICPPIVYIGLFDSPSLCQSKIKGANVLKEAILPLKFKEETCGRCSVNIRCNKEDKSERISVSYYDGTVIPYRKSKCHPRFVQRYNTAQKVFGGLAHMATLGIGLFVGWAGDRETWPGFTNSDEECPECKQSPGAVGCTLVHTTVQFGKGMRSEWIEVDHTNDL